MKLRVVGLLSCVLLMSGLVACGGDDVTPPPPEVDAGETDAGPRDAAVDAGRVDAAACPDEDSDGYEAASCGGDDCDDTDPTRYPGATEICDLDDEDCNDATFGADADDDGFESAACCNGSGNCGLDCDDTLNTVNPGAAEVCNGGIDDDCDGLGDAAEGVCTACPAGFEGMGTDCTDIDECATGGYCGSGATSCTNVIGTFVCTCGPGYFAATPVGSLCENIDECAAAVNPCGTGTCIDNAGSYTCGCPAGFHDLGTGCIDIDECATGGYCGTGATSCTNVVGAFACGCGPGYFAATAVGSLCENIDECAAAVNPCSTGACFDNAGSYTCGCPVGFHDLGTGCIDINECATGGYCGTGATSCTNVVGTFVCTCGTGYSAATATGSLCENIDECAAASNPCGAGACADNAGSYVCSCPAGYRLVSSPSITCVDVDECAEDTDQCIVVPPVALCANTPGSYTCTCPTGYEGSGRIGTSCTNVNECARGLDDCDANAACADTPGSFTCTCNPGYAGTGHGAGSCVDVNECATGTPCGVPGTGCVNSVGSYACSCGAGYAAPVSGGTCLDVNECALGTYDCDTAPVASCGNTTGSYVCACPIDYVGTGHGPDGCGPRFTDLGGGLVRDNGNGLVWQQTTPPGGYTQAGAIAYCAGLTLGGGGWRLPTNDELLTIVDRRYTATKIDPTYFPATPGANFWSSTPVAGMPTYGWQVNFYTGNPNTAVATTSTNRARCVR